MPCKGSNTNCNNKCASVFYVDGGNTCVTTCPTGKVPNLTKMECEATSNTIILRLDSKIPD
jgi:hypothetical protein